MPGETKSIDIIVTKTMTDENTGIVENITDEGSVIINNREFYTGDIL